VLGDLIVVDLQLFCVFVGESFDSAKRCFTRVSVDDPAREDSLSARFDFDRSESCDLGNEHDGTARCHLKSHVCHE